MVTGLSVLPSGATVVALFAAAVATTGCGEPMPCGLRACDVRDSQCQHLIATSSACLRGVPLVEVPVAVIKRDDYIRGEMATPLTPEQEQRFRTRTDGLALFGMAAKNQSPAEYAGVSAAWVGAFYSSDTRSITILDDGYALDSIYFVSMLAHEYQHAIQDVRYGIATIYEGYATTSDSALAIGAVIEGEASVVGDRALVHLFGDSPDDVPWSQVFREWQARQRASGLASSDPVTLAYSTFSYAFGTPYLHQAIAAGGWPAADGVFAAPPGGAREVMAGFQAAVPGNGVWAEDLGNDAVPVLDSRFAFQRADRMGAWIVGLLIGRAVILADDPTRQVTGDELSFFRDQVSGTVVAVWRVRFAAADVAQSVSDAIGSALPAGVTGWAPVRSQLVDRDLVLIAAADAVILDAIPSDLTFQAVPPTTSPGRDAAPGDRRPLEIRCPLPAPFH